jgi:hypothetical protein
VTGAYPVPVVTSATRRRRSFGIEGWIISGSPKVLMNLCWMLSLFQVSNIPLQHDSKEMHIIPFMFSSGLDFV